MFNKYDFDRNGTVSAAEALRRADEIWRENGAPKNERPYDNLIKFEVSDFNF